MDKEKHSLIYSRHINELIYKLIPKNKKILDVGCNTGNLGEKLIKEKNCEVWGIDYSKEAIKLAKKRLTQTKVFDLETYKIPFPKEKFDIIIFADVLEHLRYPEEILKKFSNMLNESGLVFTSIPNIANIKIRFNLLLGKWDYQEEGILDKTHLRFFTKKTIRSLFRNSGYRIIEMDSTPGFKFFVLRYFKFLLKIQETLCKIYPKLFALQFIVIAKK